MAKQMIGPLERHLEKAILGVTAILLIGSAAVYLVSSPNVLELGGETVTPSTIDAKLAKRASSVREDIRRADSDSSEVESLASSFESKINIYRDGRIPLTLASANSVGPKVPVADAGDAAPGERSLVGIAPLGRVGATRGRSTFVFYDASGNEEFSIANWVTLSGVFDVTAQLALQRDEYGASHTDVFFGPPELQRRVPRSDGSWSDDDWQEIEPWPASNIDPPPDISIVVVADEAVLDPQSRLALDRYTLDLTEPMKQLRSLRPLLPETQNGDGWSFPTLTSYRDVVVQDQEFLFPESPGADQLDRYGVEGGSGIVLEGKAALTFSERKKHHEAEYDRLMDSAQNNQISDDAVKAYNEAQEIFTDLEAGTSDKNRASKMKADAEQLEFDIARRLKRRAGKRPGRGSGGGKAGAEPVREIQPFQQMWVHDAGPGSVQSGQSYQYRMRSNILNGLAGEPQKFHDKQNAALVLIAGAWTEPVEVTIPADTVFFLTSKDKGKGTAKFQIYKWEEGVWVESRRFAFSVGDELMGESRVKLPAPDGSGGSYNALVDFEMGGTVIDIDFDRSYRERKKVSSSRTGVKFADASKACSVVFVDAFGSLHERFVPTDKANPERKIIKGQVYPKK